MSKRLGGIIGCKDKTSSFLLRYYSADLLVFVLFSGSTVVYRQTVSTFSRVWTLRDQSQDDNVAVNRRDWCNLLKHVEAHRPA